MVNIKIRLIIFFAAEDGEALYSQQKQDWGASWEIWMQVKKQQLEPGIEQYTASKLGKEYVKAVYCYPTYLM